MKIYKYGFWLLLLLLLTAIHIIVRYGGIKTSKGALDEKNKLRLSSLAVSDSLVGKPWDKITLRNIITEQEQYSPSDSLTAVLLLSNLGCSVCQNRELQNLEQLYNKQNKIKILAVFNENTRTTALKLRKVNQITFPFYEADESVFNKYSFSEHYPQLLLIKKNEIISTFLPIPYDDEFSTWYMNRIKNCISFN